MEVAVVGVVPAKSIDPIGTGLAVVDGNERLCDCCKNRVCVATGNLMKRVPATTHRQVWGLTPMVLDAAVAQNSSLF